MSTTDLGALYAASRHRMTDLFMSSSAEDHELPCPATPEWKVRDVLAHVRGITEDVRTGNLEGVTTDPWTAAQVKRHSDTSVADLLDGWTADASLLEAVLSSEHGVNVARAVIDVHTHEADVRGALGRVAPLTDEFAAWGLAAVLEGVIAGITAAGLAPVRVVTDEGDELGPADATVVLRAPRYELFRATLGRRSAAQVAAFDWSGTDPTPYLPHLFLFGPRTTDLVEAHRPG